MQIPINKEIRHYQEEIFLGLNLRQMICSGAAIAVAVAVYLGLTPLLGHETAGSAPVSYTHLRAPETDSSLLCRLLLEKKKKTNYRKSAVMPKK